MRIFSICFIVMISLLGGCAVQNKYNWNGYDKGLYDAYKDPSQIKPLQIKMQETVNLTEQQKQKVPPGMYAELGTLFLQEGLSDTAKMYYSKERDSWPESKTLMDLLIKNLDSRSKPLEKSNP